MKQHVKLGVIALARKTFDWQEAQKIYTKTVGDLETLENVDIIAEENLVIEVEDARRAAEKISAEHVDGLIVISATFHLGHLALTIQKYFENTPLLLWAFDELPYDGGKIRLNSVCGLNLNASNLYKAGVDGYVAHVGNAVPEDFVDAVRMTAALKSAHVAMIGYHAHGFFNLGVEALAPYRNFGVLIDHFELSDFFGRKASEERILARKESILKTFDASGITEKQVDLLANLVESAKSFLDENGINCAAVRCWPEMAASYGISPCAAMSVLADEGYILACEGDIEGALSMLCFKAVGTDTPFLADLSQVDLKEDFALMWHDGVAAPSLCDGNCAACLDTYFAGGKGVTADFTLKPGRITIARIDTARGKTRLLTALGTAESVRKEIKGTYSKVRFDEGTSALLEKVIYTGVAHHVAYAYGEHEKTLKTFAKINGLEVL